MLEAPGDGLSAENRCCVLSIIAPQTLAKKEICRGKNLVTSMDMVGMGPATSPLRVIFPKEHMKPFVCSQMYLYCYLECVSGGFCLKGRDFTRPLIPSLLHALLSPAEYKHINESNYEQTRLLFWLIISRDLLNSSCTMQAAAWLTLHTRTHLSGLPLAVIVILFVGFDARAVRTRGRRDTLVGVKEHKQNSHSSVVQAKHNERAEAVRKSSFRGLAWGTGRNPQRPDPVLTASRAKVAFDFGELQNRLSEHVSRSQRKWETACRKAKIHPSQNKIISMKS